MEPMICPRCGTENPADTLNCEACRINLQFARENPDEIERLVQEDIHREQLAADALRTDFLHMSAPKDEAVLLPVLLLLGSFVFAFILGEAVHELGHVLAHRLYGYQVGMVLDPFGGSRTLGSSSPRDIWGPTTAAGPLLNLLAALLIFMLLWPRRRPALLPLLLWGPLALIQEGVTLSLGMLTPGGDAELIVEWGVPAPLILALGILFLASGVALVCWVLPLVSLSPTDSLGRKFSVVAGGMASFMLLRFLVSSVISPTLAQENVVPLIFTLLLAAIVVLLFGPLYPFLNRISETEPVPVSGRTAVLSIALAVGMVLFQLITFN